MPGRQKQNWNMMKSQRPYSLLFYLLSAGKLLHERRRLFRELNNRKDEGTIMEREGKYIYCIIGTQQDRDSVPSASGAEMTV